MSQVVNVDQLLAEFHCYSNVGRVKQDVMALSRSVRTMIPKKGSLIRNDGTESTLLVLGGTVPISFRGSTYNIPVEIFITEPFPNSPPMCYVRPTNNMMLKIPHRHVDSEGLVYLPYLHTWNARTHNLTDLVGHVSAVFGQDPPLYAKPSQPNPPPPQYHNVVSSSQRSSESNTMSQPPSYQSVSRGHAADPKQEALELLTRKLQSKLHGFYSGLRDDIDAELERQAKLADQQADMEASGKMLDMQKANLQEQIARATERVAALDAWLAAQAAAGAAAGGEEEDPQALVAPRNRWSQQLLEKEAEAHAIDDLLYHLEAGLRAARCPLDVRGYLAETRKLARRQFMAKALIRRIEEEMRALPS